MHKLLSTFLLAFAVPCCVVAQSVSFPRLSCSAKHRAHTPTGHHYAPANDSRYAAKTTATASRLVAMVSLDYDGTSFVPVDSVSASYSGGRGGKYNEKWEDWEWAYDNTNGYEYNPATSSYGSSVFRSNQTFDASDHILTSTSEEWAAHLGTWRNSWKDTYTYDAAGNRTVEMSQTWDTTAGTWKNLYKDTYTYTASGKVATNISQLWNSGAGVWGDGSRITYTYDGAGNRITSVNDLWNSSTSAWENQSRADYTYDGAGNLTSERYGMWDGTSMSWDTSGRRTYTYDASNRRTEELNETKMSGVWEPNSKVLYSNFAGDKPQTVLYQNWDGGLMAFTDDEREHYTYNADGMVTYLYNETWDDPTAAWVMDGSYAIRNRYETYTTGIAAGGRPENDLLVYPVPTANSLTLRGSWESAEPLTVVITDAAGRICSQLSKLTVKGHSVTIPTAQLQAGVYLLTVQTGNEKAVRPFVKVE